MTKEPIHPSVYIKQIMEENGWDYLEMYKKTKVPVHQIKKILKKEKAVGKITARKLIGCTSVPFDVLIEYAKRKQKNTKKINMLKIKKEEAKDFSYEKLLRKHELKRVENGEISSAEAEKIIKSNTKRRKGIEHIGLSRYSKKVNTK